MTTWLMCAWLAIAPGVQGGPAKDAWLKGFEGTWVIDNPRGSEANISLSITRDASALVLRVMLDGREVVTRYDFSGRDVINTGPSGIRGIFRTRIDNQKLITESWTDKVAGPPERIETRYLESADVMVTDLSRTPGGPVFNRTKLRRKAS